MVRSALYQAAHVLMRHGRWSSLSWLGDADRKRSGAKLAKVALARSSPLSDSRRLEGRNAAGQAAQAEVIAPPRTRPFCRAASYALNALDRLVMRTLFRLRVEGTEHLPQQGPICYARNRASYLTHWHLPPLFPGRSCGRCTGLEPQISCFRAAGVGPSAGQCQPSMCEARRMACLNIVKEGRAKTR